ncbi:MAG: hypothetical protein MI862_29535, partial [Desulfobacterales bacterium]|nr:hypothetical protein [Desulfobacterales bacterium]
LLAVSGSTQVHANKKISASQYELINWMQFYYTDPSPNAFPNWLKRLSAEGLLRDEKRQFPFLGFAATIFEANARKVPEWIEGIDALPKKDRKTVYIALWLSNTKESRNLLSDVSRRRLLETRNYFNFQTEHQPPKLNEIDKYWGFLDIQWGWFLASGAKEPVENITSVLTFASFLGSKKKYPEPKTKEEKWAVINERLFQSAMRSLQSNCKTHSRVMEICEEIYEEGTLEHLAQWSLKSILIDVKPDKYKI